MAWYGFAEGETSDGMGSPGGLACGRTTAASSGAWDALWLDMRAGREEGAKASQLGATKVKWNFCLRRLF